MTTTATRSSRVAITRKLSHFLTTPSKVASALNWREINGSILSLDISTNKKDTIGLALASHPAQQEETRINLKPINIKYETTAGNNKRILSSQTINELQSIVTKNNVCSLVIGWPLINKNRNNRIGASCGKVLHTLDKLIESSTVLDNKPFCLHTIPSSSNGEIVDDTCEEEEEDDEWGRSPLWARPCSDPNQTEYVASSKEQYDCNHDDNASNSNAVAVDVINDFLQEQWSDLCYETQQQQQQMKPTKNRSSSYDNDWLENSEATGCSSGLKFSLL